MMALWELLKNTRMDLSLDHIAESTVDVDRSLSLTLVVSC